jgi:hypothetical protein
MNPNVRQWLASLALVALGAVGALAVTRLVSHPRLTSMVTKIQGRVHPIRIKHSQDVSKYEFDNAKDKLVSMNSASTVFWLFKVKEKDADSAVIQFDAGQSPFKDGGRFVFTPDIGVVAGVVSAGSNPLITYPYHLIVFRKPPNPSVEVDPGIIIDDNQPKDSTQHQP